MTDILFTQTRTYSGRGHKPWTVELTCCKVPIPPESRAAWHSAVADLYERLEELIEADHLAASTQESK